MHLKSLICFEKYQLSKMNEIFLKDCASYPCKSGSKSPGKCNNESNEFDNCADTIHLYLRLKSGQEWVRPTSMVTLFEAISRFTSSGMRYRFVGGNTASGQTQFPKIWILILQLKLFFSKN